MTDKLLPFLEDMLSMSTGTDGRTLQIHFCRPITAADRQAIADAHNAIVRGELTATPEPSSGWIEGVETAPHATTVLATYFDHAVGEWIVQLFVAELPAAPFTHWMFVGRPGELAPQPISATMSTAELASHMKDFEAFAAQIAPKLHWKIWQDTGSDLALYSGGFDGWRHGFGMTEFEPLLLPDLIAGMKVALTAALTAEEVSDG